MKNQMLLMSLVVSFFASAGAQARLNLVCSRDAVRKNVPVDVLVLPDTAGGTGDRTDYRLYILVNGIKIEIKFPDDDFVLLDESFNVKGAQNGAGPTQVLTGMVADYFKKNGIPKKALGLSEVYLTIDETNKILKSYRSKKQKKENRITLNTVGDSSRAFVDPSVNHVLFVQKGKTIRALGIPVTHIQGAFKKAGIKYSGVWIDAPINLFPLMLKSYLREGGVLVYEKPERGVDDDPSYKLTPEFINDVVAQYGQKTAAAVYLSLSTYGPDIDPTVVYLHDNKIHNLDLGDFGELEALKLSPRPPEGQDGIEYSNAQYAYLAQKIVDYVMSGHELRFSQHGNKEVIDINQIRRILNLPRRR